ncbi:Solute carrier family 13 member 5, partial [Araneus ventricosus]
MFVGGLLVAVAVEDCKLHERIALKVLLMIGSEIKWLMMGFMVTTMLLSMWISNTATTAMMVPIVDAVIGKITMTSIDDDIPLEE